MGIPLGSHGVLSAAKDLLCAVGFFRKKPTAYSAVVPGGEPSGPDGPSGPREQSRTAHTTCRRSASLTALSHVPSEAEGLPKGRYLRAAADNCREEPSFAAIVQELTVQASAACGF